VISRPSIGRALKAGGMKAGILNGGTILLRPALSKGWGDRSAIEFENQTVTYDQLNQRSNRFAAACVAAGVEPGDRVAILLLDRPAFVYAFVGAMKAGAVPIAVNTRAVATEIAHILEDSNAKMVVAEEFFDKTLNPALTMAKTEPRVVLLGDQGSLEDFIGGHDPAFPGVPRLMNDMAFWSYSSGSTGQPKGVVHTLDTILAADSYMTEILKVKAGDRLFSSSKLFFAFTLGHILIGGLRSGATIILYHGWPAPEDITAVVERHRPTVMFSVPTFFKKLLNSGAVGAPIYQEIESYVAAGESLPATIFRQWQGITGRAILEGIGSTETMYMFLANARGWEMQGVTGTPAPGVDVRLIDHNGDQIEEPGLPGVLWVRMSGLAREYWQMPERSAEVFNNGWFKTGDLFVFDGNGCFYHQGRADDLVKISGQWVSPAEVEKRINENENVHESAVVGISDRDGLTRLACFIVPNNRQADREALETALLESLTTSLPIYKCPRRFAFLDELPRTASGKIQRFKLRQLAADQISAR